MTIEDVILDRDRRGISALRPHLPPDFCRQAARFILQHPGRTLITTGFYILDAGVPETDGPPGAIAIGQALEALGFEVVHVSDRHTVPLLRSLLGQGARVVEFPIEDHEASRRRAERLLQELEPTVLIAIERCGLTDEGLYRNMRGRDITPYNAKVDYLFHHGHPSVGIGDGGNEIGMGDLADVIPTVPSLVRKPCVTRTSRLVISSVSNWGGYGLAAALSLEAGRRVLLSTEEERDLVRRCVDAGAVDGMSAKAEYKVDGFTLEENSQTLVQLHRLLDEASIPA